MSDTKETKIKAIGEVRKINNSLYFLIPYRTAQELKVGEGTSFKLTVNEGSPVTEGYELSYHIPRES